MQKKPLITGLSIVFITAVSVLTIGVGLHSYADIFGQNVQSGGGFVAGGSMLASSGGGFMANSSTRASSGGGFIANGNNVSSGIQSGPGFFDFNGLRAQNDVPVSIINIDYSSYMYLGGRFKFISNLNFYEGRTVKWYSNHPEIIYVEEDGNAIVLGNGQVEITARDDRGNVSTLQQNVWLRDQGYTKSSALRSNQILKLVNSKTGAYIYSADELEINAYIYSNTGWKIDSYLGESGTPADTPVFRAINRNTGRYAYTSDRNVYVNLCRYGWMGEGIIFFTRDKGIDWEKM